MIATCLRRGESPPCNSMIEETEKERDRAGSEETKDTKEIKETVTTSKTISINHQNYLKANGWRVSLVLSLHAASMYWVDRDGITPPDHRHHQSSPSSPSSSFACDVVSTTCAREMNSSSSRLWLICIPGHYICTWWSYLHLVIICTFIINCAIYNYNRHSVIWKYSPQNNPRPIAINRDLVDTGIVHLHIHRHDSVWFDLTITIHINFDWKSHYFQFWKS